VDLIETPRLRLEPLDASRLDDFIALTAEQETMRYWVAGGPFTRDIRDEAFERLELESIVAVHHPDNAASRRVVERLGMAFERDVVAKNGWPYCLHRLTQERWTGVR
jgi:hypothetical protein